MLPPPLDFLSPLGRAEHYKVFYLIACRERRPNRLSIHLYRQIKVRKQIITRGKTMDIQMLRVFFMWCTIINAAILIPTRHSRNQKGFRLCRVIIF